MKLMIDISEEDYETAKKVEALYGEWRNDVTSRSLKAIANGTLLPKGYGRLIILSEDIVKREKNTFEFSSQKWISEVNLSNATIAIVDADRSEEE